jgi:hypothetical protein
MFGCDNYVTLITRSGAHELGPQKKLLSLMVEKEWTHIPQSHN